MVLDFLTLVSGAFGKVSVFYKGARGRCGLVSDSEFSEFVLSPPPYVGSGEIHARSVVWRKSLLVREQRRKSGSSEPNFRTEPTRTSREFISAHGRHCA